jgi:hypothetical protein
LAARRDEIEVRLKTLALALETARSWAHLNFLIPSTVTMNRPKDQP